MNDKSSDENCHSIDSDYQKPTVARSLTEFNKCDSKLIEYSLFSTPTYKGLKNIAYTQYLIED